MSSDTASTIQHIPDIIENPFKRVYKPVKFKYMLPYIEKFFQRKIMVVRASAINGVKSYKYVISPGKVTQTHNAEYFQANTCNCLYTDMFRLREGDVYAYSGLAFKIISVDSNNWRTSFLGVQLDQMNRPKMKSVIFLYLIPPRCYIIQLLQKKPHHFQKLHDRLTKMFDVCQGFKVKPDPDLTLENQF